MVSDSFGSTSGESNPNPSSMQAFNSSKSSSETLLLRRRRLGPPLPLFLLLPLRLSHASSRWISGDHECCLQRGRGGAWGLLDMGLRWLRGFFCFAQRERERGLLWFSYNNNVGISNVCLRLRVFGQIYYWFWRRGGIRELYFFPFRE